MMPKHVLQDFIEDIHNYINFWKNTTKTDKEKLQGLAHSILCMLDGVSGDGSYCIESIEKASRGLQLHELFYANKR